MPRHGRCRNCEAYQAKATWLASRDVTDDGLAHVAKLKQLEELDLPESITPDGLKHLTGLTNLRKLSFSNIFIDEAKNPVRLSHALDLLINRQQRGLRECFICSTIRSP